MIRLQDFETVYISFMTPVIGKSDAINQHKFGTLQFS